MINIRKLTTDDVPKLNLKAAWIEQMYIKYLSDEVPAWMVEDENGPLCAFGGTQLWPGVGEVWFNLIRKERVFTIIRIAKKYLRDQARKHGIRRLHATVNAEFKVGRRFVEAMGFVCETPEGMKQYNPDGSTAFMYSRIL